MGDQNTVAKWTENIVQPEVLASVRQAVQQPELLCQGGKNHDSPQEKTSPSEAAGTPLTAGVSEREHCWEEEAGCHCGLAH